MVGKGARDGKGLVASHGARASGADWRTGLGAWCGLRRVPGAGGIVERRWREGREAGAQRMNPERLEG